MPVRFLGFFKQARSSRSDRATSSEATHVVRNFQKLYAAALRPASAYGHDLSPREYRYVEAGVEASLQELGLVEIDRWGAMLYETDPEKLRRLKGATLALLEANEMKAPSLSKLRVLLDALLVRLEARLG